MAQDDFTPFPPVVPPFPVVGIGASAGGLHALQILFEALPDKTGAAFVVIVHLDPQHPSYLTSILSLKTTMKVLQVAEPTQLHANTVYVIPPNRHLLVSGDKIEAAAFEEPRGQRAPIDLFFRSFASEYGEGFAVVLSGSGSDGALGVRAVREKGGLILVQDPDEAEYSSMPQNAIASGADFVLPVKELAVRLASLIRAKSQLGAKIKTDDANDNELVARILEHVRVKTGHDFSRYKRPTVMRRLMRRMQVTGTDSLSTYLSHIEVQSAEVQNLFSDLLISVTSFFRDSYAFNVLAETVIPRLFERDDAIPIRVWVPACATGEEAYSLLILLLEEADKQSRPAEIQLFATDLDTEALKIAREGFYSHAIGTDVSDERLRRFFLADGSQYRIRQEIRDRIVFAAHNLLKDPPFSRVDLISCRNMLIYVDRDAQQHVCKTLYYALRPGRYLFLGSSESADNPTGLFTVFEREAHIFRSNSKPDRVPPLPGAYQITRPLEVVTSPRRAARPSETDGALHRQVLEAFAPPSMLVNEGHGVIHLSETAGRFMMHPSGPVTSDAVAIVRSELQMELRAGLRRAFEQDSPTITLPIPVRFDSASHSVALHVAPVTRKEGRLALVIFMDGGVIKELEPRSAAENAEIAASAHLRDELLATRDYLRSTREQYETATEDLRAANEELQSINEEYRSTAEELETSKEELQSINEELQTLNNEMKTKLELVSRSHSDLQNLITATDVATLFLDRNMRIKLFTPGIVNIFNITDGDEGRLITDFTHHLYYKTLIEDARKVLAELIPVERLVDAETDRSFLTRLRPYRTMEDRIDGVVATFVDMTDRHRSDRAWKTQQTMLLGELTHRVKNTLAVVQAITHQTLTGSGISPEKLDILDARLAALAASHDLLVTSQWKGASFEAIVQQQLAQYIVGGGQKVQLSGPAVILPPSLATSFALLLHELSTNAAKYGAFSTPQGTVKVQWSQEMLEDGTAALRLVWMERGGPPVPPAPEPHYGTTTIKNVIADSVVSFEYAAKGLVCTILAPLQAHRSVEPNGSA